MAIIYGDQNPANPNDLLYGTDEDDEIYGLTGNDSIFGSAGADLIYGGAGDDRIEYRASLQTEGLAASIDGGDGLDNLEIFSEAPGQFISFDRLVLTNVELINCFNGAFGTKDANLIDVRSVTAFGARFGLLGGDDTYRGGMAGDVVDGGDGDDLIEGNDGFDFLNSGSGADTVLGGAGDDIIGVSGTDFALKTIDGGAGQDRLGVTGVHQIDRLDFADYSIESLNMSTTVESAFKGTDGANLFDLRNLDRFSGKLDMGAGDDTVRAETVWTPDGATVDGGGGDDWISTGDGVDPYASYHLFGGDGNDSLSSGDGGASLSGGAGDDQLRSGGGRDTLAGGGDDDFLSSGAGNDSLYGEAGEDKLFGGAGNDSLYGGVGDDLISAGDGDDTVWANDVGLGADTILGGAGNDLFLVVAKDLFRNTFSGGAGFDEMAINDQLRADAMNSDDFGVEKVRVGQIYGTADANLFDLSEVEQFYGQFFMGGGDDTVRATGGGMDVRGEDGDDEIFVGDSPTTSGRFVSGDAGNDTLGAGIGNDLFECGTGDDQADAGAGNDRLFGGEGRDILLGGLGADSLSGEIGNDSLDGGKGSDTLAGGTGIDTISGGGGTDTLIGGGSADILSGGAGADAFQFDAVLKSKQAVTITDFKAGVDRFVLGADSFGDIPPGELARDAFVVGPAARDSEDRIVYDAEKGRLWFDADGSGRGAAIKFATVEPGLDLSHLDFFAL